MKDTEWRTHYGPYQEQQVSKAETDIFVFKCSCTEHEARIVKHDNGMYYVEIRRRS